MGGPYLGLTVGVVVTSSEIFLMEKNDSSPVS